MSDYIPREIIHKFQKRTMSDYIPEEILHKILLTLPIKSLIKFTLVCKSWKSLIESSTFIQSHLRSTIDSNDQNDSHLFLLSASGYYCREEKTTHQYHWLHWDTPESGEHSMLSPPVSFSKDDKDRLTVVGTSNGLVCLQVGECSTNRFPSLIWNPSIRKVVMLPKPPVCFKYTKYGKYTTHGFGYDSHSNDYKIYRIVALIDDESNLSRFATEVQVYSLARGSWKSRRTSDIPVDLQGDSVRPVFVNGIVHTLETRLTVCSHKRCKGHQKYHCDKEFQKSFLDFFIWTFNLATEEYGKIMGPEALREASNCSILRYGDSLAMTKANNSYNFSCMSHDIWVLKEYGVAESWTYMFNIPVVEADICGFKRCGEAVLERKHDRVLSRMSSFDPKTNQRKVLRTEEYIFYFMDSFIPSLVLLDHANAISYQVEMMNCKHRYLDRVLLQKLKQDDDHE